MTQFYFRDGRALTEKQNEIVRTGKRGDSGTITHRGPCSRCGGAGGSPHWYPDGGVCYRCRGRNSQSFEVYTPRVFTAEKLAKLVATAEKKAAIKAAEAQRKIDAAIAYFVVWSKPHKKLLGDIAAATGNSFLSDLADKVSKSMILTDRQLEAAATAIRRIEERKIEGKASEYVGEVKERIEFEAEVTGVYGTEGFYGHTDIVKFKDVANNQFTWFASDYTDLKRGDRMTIKGTVKKHEDYRDVKQTVLTRCKFTKFEIVTADDAAKLEDVA